MTIVFVQEDINTSSKSTDRDCKFRSTPETVWESCHIGTQ